MHSEPSDNQKREALSSFERGRHAFDRQSYLLHLRHYQEALSALDDAFKRRYENEGWIPFQRADIYKQTGRENEFAQEMQLAIRLGLQVAQAAPHDQRLAFNLALYLLASGQQQEAREHYARVLAQKPSREHLEMAIEGLESWLETQPSDAFARTTLASIQDLLSQGRAARAARSH